MLILLLLLQACSSLPRKEGILTQQGNFEVAPILGSLWVKRAVLPNGLKLIIVEDSSSPTFAYQTWYNVGSRHEVRGKTGLAHLFEHMMFKGTTRYPEGLFDSILESVGAEGENAYTTTDHTVYVQELPKKQLDLIIELESDRMTNLVVNDQSFKTEREVVQNERRYRKENSPEGTLMQTLFEMVYQDHPYHWPVIGYEQDLNVMSAQDARDFYQKFYSPDRATVVVVGDVDANQVYQKIKSTYGQLPARNTLLADYKMDPPQKAQKRKTLPLNMQGEKLWMAYRIPNSRSMVSSHFELIQGILSDGLNSRLDRALKDTGIASTVSSGAMNLYDESLFIITVNLQKGKSPFLAESIILQELERLKKTNITDAEMERAKNIYDFKYNLELSNSSGLAEFLGDAETLHGHFIHGIHQRLNLNSVTATELKNTVQEYFKSEKLTVLVGKQKS